MAVANGTPPVETMSHLTESHIKDSSSKPQLKDLDASHVTITKTSTLRPVPEPNSKEVWGSKSCSDHMISVKWTVDQGWHAPEIKPYGPLTMMPTASCLHYATQCFEGMKVYRGFDGKLRLFRPERNCNRLVMSAQRVVLPAFDPVELEKLLKLFLGLDGPRWLPKSRPGSFLYVRPAIIGNGEELGVTAPSEVLLFVIAVPWPDLAGTPPGAAPKPPGLKLLASKEDTRAWPGGFGYAKVGANYGPSFVPQMEGRKLGYDQILWLFGPDYQVTEAGASNFFVVIRNKTTSALELITAPTTDKIILDGVTRRSVLDLAQSRLTANSPYLSSSENKTPITPLEIVERTYSMLEIEEAQKEGRLMEAFTSGTAEQKEKKKKIWRPPTNTTQYFVTPVSAINFREQEIDIPMSEGDSGLYAKIIKGWLYDIMYGNVQHEWGVVIDEDE
ncbi:putative branched-chain-amino-acid mitochondrial precursor protein [Rutstroemia sp. NJR-2017a WRK4]|nr:putative branched-chain-amino-acid mitochondrial precursor protein [Rutstroemia sp. NJR-2017a WRK4]